MKKPYILLLFICHLVFFGNAQSVQKEVFGSAGGTDSVPGYKVQWTIGECLTEKLNGTNCIATQGFHQYYYTVTSLPEIPKVKFNLKVFPNPTRDYLNIDVQYKVPEKFHFILYTQDGKILTKGEFFSANLKRVDLTKYGSNLMFLKIVQVSSKQSVTFKIIKTSN